jgi:ribosomal protein S18 acetylase RimI-like enzyme
MTSVVQYGHELLMVDSGPEFDAFYRIYVEAIAARERKPEEEIRALVTMRGYRFLLLKDGSVVIGFSMLFISPDRSFSLLEYMAVSRECRNSGAGTELFRRTFLDDSGAFAKGPVLIEVDSDREQSADRQLRQRRQNFYRRCGCLRIDQLSYILPLPGKGQPPQMDLMICFHAAAAALSRQQVERWLTVIYCKVYGCPQDDSRIARMVARVSDLVRLI